MRSIRNFRRGLGLTELLFIFEAFFGSFNVSITRSITPIFLVRLGYKLSDLLVLNAMGGFLALLIAITLYNIPRITVTKSKLVIALIVERIMWIAIFFTSPYKELLPIIYGFALAFPLASGVFLNVSMLSLFEENTYRRVVSLRGALGGLSSIFSQFITVAVLMFYGGIAKYLFLYLIAFLVGLLSPVLMFFIPSTPTIKRVAIKTSEEIEVKVSNIFLLVTMYLTAVSLLNIAWIPYLLNVYGVPDYYVAMIGFTQTLTSIVSSIFWAHRSYKTYRSAMIILGIVPVLIRYTPIPMFHLLYAVFLSFANVGANFYASFAYAGLIKKMGVYRAGILLPAASYLALTIAGFTGYITGGNYTYAFILSTIYSVLGLSIALLALPELSIVKSTYTRIYSKILHNTTIFGYSVMIYSLSSTAKLVLKMAVLVFALLILYLIYKTIYYIIVFGGGI